MEFRCSRAPYDFKIPIKLTEYLAKSTLQHTFRHLEHTQRLLRFPSHRTCDHSSCRLSTAINSPQILLCELTHTLETFFFPLLYVSAYLNLHGFIIHTSSVVFCVHFQSRCVYCRPVCGDLCVQVTFITSSERVTCRHISWESAPLSAAKAIFQMSALVASLWLATSCFPISS